MRLHNGTPFHRTAKLQDGTPFVIQGGDPKGTGSRRPRLHHPGRARHDAVQARTVAMGPHLGAQLRRLAEYFIVLDDKDGDVLASANTYQIIGSVTSGMDVADAIYAASGGHELPANPVKVTTASSPTPDATALEPERQGAKADHRTKGVMPMTTATIATDIGDIEVALYDESAPKAAANFITLARKGFYDDVVFHRVIRLRRPGRRRQYGRSRRSSAGASGPVVPATSSRTSPCRVITFVARSPWPTPGPNTTGASSFILPPGPDRQAAEELHPVRPGHPGDGCGTIGSWGRHATAATFPTDPVAMTSVTIHDDEG